ncbi:MAG: nucleotide exchange factor GrpE [Ignavibacteria bacterium]|nr:nucleotide exchange factor GrpE [Ignavibacteria bacterium]
MTKNRKDKTENDKIKSESTEIPVNDTKEHQDKSDIESDRSAALEKAAADWKEQFIRKAAEFENYKKRTDAEKADFFSYASEKLLNELLPVLDDFDRIMKSYDDKHDAEDFKKGVDLVYAKFKNTLEKQGLKEMNSDDKPFDVNLHEAILQQPVEEAEANTILHTAEKGYFIKDKVLRHAKVIVSTKPEQE